MICLNARFYVKVFERADLTNRLQHCHKNPKNAINSALRISTKHGRPPPAPGPPPCFFSHFSFSQFQKGKRWADHCLSSENKVIYICIRTDGHSWCSRISFCEYDSEKRETWQNHDSCTRDTSHSFSEEATDPTKTYWTKTYRQQSSFLCI